MEAIVFKTHRINMLDLMKDNSVLVSFSRPKVDVKKDVNRNYYYLSGNFEYDNIVLLSKINGVCKEQMFIHPYDELKEKWYGAPLSEQQITDANAIEDVLYLEMFEDTLDRYLMQVPTIYVDMQDTTDELSFELNFAKKQKEKHTQLVVLNANDLFKVCRTVKHPLEVEQMRKAIGITKKGIEEILNHMTEAYEYQLESFFDQAIRYHGATGYAFPTIAASGKNACCLHYMANEDKTKNGDLILFDLGCSYDMYCSDISRTFPVNGKFTKRQKELYNIVLKGQEVVMQATKPGITTKELNQILIDFYAIELKNIGLIKDKSDVLKYYYHGVSHHIGLDCHDNCVYTPLKAGSVISCEPGLYIKEEGIGIRIEDDLLVTETGCENLSKDILKTVEEIEAYMAGGKKK